MENFWKWFATSKLASILRVAVAYIIGNMVAQFAQVGDFDVSSWKSWIIGAFVVVLPMVLRWLNPADTAFDAKG